ncbi:MAG: hypothetical protein HZB26_14820 [Candidatus Hydrogenedentes bacterium]|nr:hypothetical protein [Candidatus Hydrogenedentota bacterium]
MDEFERNIRDDLLAATPQWQARAADVREGVKAMYEEKRKRAARLTWIGTAVGAFLMFLGVAGIICGIVVGSASVAVSTSCTVVGAMMFLFGDGWITGSKLLYWTWNSRLQIERDLKEMHADVLDVSKRLEQIERAAQGGATPQTP